MLSIQATQGQTRFPSSEQRHPEPRRPPASSSRRDTPGRLHCHPSTGWDRITYKLRRGQANLKTVTDRVQATHSVNLRTDGRTTSTRHPPTLPDFPGGSRNCVRMDSGGGSKKSVTEAPAGKEIDYGEFKRRTTKVQRVTAPLGNTTKCGPARSGKRRYRQEKPGAHLTLRPRSTTPTGSVPHPGRRPRRFSPKRRETNGPDTDHQYDAQNRATLVKKPGPQGGAYPCDLQQFGGARDSEGRTGNTRSPKQGFESNTANCNRRCIYGKTSTDVCIRRPGKKNCFRSEWRRHHPGALQLQ